MIRDMGTHGMNASGDETLAAYLHSHLIAAAAGERLFGQAAKTWKNSPHGVALGRLATEVSADKAELQDITRGIGLEIPAYKKPLAWIGARIASLGPLNPFHAKTGAPGQLEIEALISAVTGKSLLWKTLVLLSRSDSRIEYDLVARLLDRATEQIRELERILLDTAEERFAGPGR